MASDHQRLLVWESLLHAEILHRYYGYLAEHLEKKDARLVWAALVATSGAAMVLIGDYPTLYAKILALLAAALNLWIALSRYSKKSLYSANLQKKFADLIVEWELLWGKVDEIPADQVEQQYIDLQKKATAITELAPVELPLDNRIQDRSEGETIRIRTAA